MAPEAKIADTVRELLIASRAYADKNPGGRCPARFLIFIRILVITSRLGFTIRSRVNFPTMCILTARDVAAGCTDCEGVVFRATKKRTL